MTWILFVVTLLFAQSDDIPVGRWVSVDEITPVKQQATEARPPAPATDKAATTNKIAELIVAPVSVVSPYYVVKFTAPNCPPCATWDRVERPKLEAAGIRIETIDVTQNKKTARDFGVTSWPRFLICSEDGRKLVLPSDTNRRQHYVGYQTAASLLGRINAITKPVTSAKPPSKTTELRRYIAGYRKANPTLTADVEPRSRVWLHLVEHGWKWSVISDLPMMDALYLHAATHEGRITP